ALFFVLFNSAVCYLFVSNPNYFINFSQIVFGINELSQVKILGLVLAFNFSLFIEFILLFFLFYRKVGDFGIKEICINFIKIILSTIAMGGGVFIVLKFWPNSLSFINDFLWFFLTCFIAGIVYIVFSFIFKIEEVKKIFKK
ncbi:MAG: hypothetical protein PHI45_02585, partial [Candidatus Pacebacteria bacterium]|nr:hypothetical protein [Candidatus Paceibacterota bacterium]